MPPKNDDWKFCNNAVILALYEDDRFIFTISKRSETKEGREKAFIFVNYTCMEDFPGFNSDEKNQLRTLGIKHVYLNGYTENGRKYLGLEDSAIHLDDIKVREHTGNNHNDIHDFNDSGLVVLLVITILIALFFAWRYWQLSRYSR